MLGAIEIKHILYPLFSWYWHYLDTPNIQAIMDILKKKPYILKDKIKIWNAVYCILSNSYFKKNVKSK